MLASYDFNDAPPKLPVSISSQIIEDFVAHGWKSNPFEKLIPLLHKEREQLLSFALQVMERIPKGGTFFDLALSHLTEAEFSAVVDQAIHQLKSGPSDVLDSVVAYASLQFPDLLTAHLRELYALRPNSGTYYEEWPWRAADDREIEWLKQAVTSQTDKRAWRCLIETRRPEALLFAAQHFQVALKDSESVVAHAHLAGFDLSGPSPRKLHSDTAYHIIFETGYFAPSARPAWLQHENHPTWVPRCETVTPANFGGNTDGTCAHCEGPLHRLIAIENTRAVLDVQLPTIELCTCMSCLGWEAPELFFSHDQAGRASSYPTNQRKGAPEFPATGLKRGPVTLVPATPRWNFQDWALANGRENLNRVGGAPSWIQDAQYCSCPQCGRLMSFIAQFDSNLPTPEGGEWLWGSGGICYIFWCDPCAISGNLWQCT